ncbi:hypothetical protein PRNP1_006288 [Phytophthora ramorum]
MDHLLNDAPEDAAEDVAVKNEAVQTLPHLATQLAANARSPSSSAAGLGLHMLSVAPAAPPRLPPISLLTAAAATLQPMQIQQQQPQLRPMLSPLRAAATSPLQAGVPTDDMLCRYRNKKCGYPRAIKRNGERHNLCERHRAKANQNQRKLESKRRTQKRVQQRVHVAADRVVKAKKVAVGAETDFTFTLYGGAVA